MPPKKKEVKSPTIHISPVHKDQVKACLVGVTSTLHNRMSQKARQELLLPSPKVKGASKELKLKHDPLQEYRDSVYFSKDPKSPTFIEHLGSAFRKAMQSAALDIPETSKAFVGRMVHVVEDRVPIWGLPVMDMRIVRMANQQRTPDVRTRALQMEWCTEFTIAFVTPQLTAEGVLNLLAAAGVFIGFNDFRNEKGAGNYGLWKLVNPNDKEFLRIKKTGGRKAQIDAFEKLGFFNDETEELYSWFVKEVENRRKLKPAKPDDKKPTKGRKKKAA